MYFRVVQVTKSIQDPLEVENNLTGIDDNVSGNEAWNKNARTLKPVTLSTIHGHICPGEHMSAHPKHCTQFALDTACMCFQVSVSAVFCLDILQL